MATDGRRGDEEALYRLHHERLVRVVRRRVGGSHALIEDACSFAWTQLLCHQPSAARSCSEAAQGSASTATAGSPVATARTLRQARRTE